MSRTDTKGKGGQWEREGGREIRGGNIMENNENAKNEGKVGFIPLLLWSANGASAAINVVLLSFLTLYCTNALGLSAALVGTLLMASKIFDGVTDICAGYLVDKTNTKIGRGRPYDICIIGLWLTTWLIFSVPESMSTTVKCIWIFVCYALCQSVFRTFMNAAGVPYMVRAFNNEQKYVKINSWGGIITTLAVIVFNVTFPMFYAKIINDAAGWSHLVMCLAIPLAIIGILRFLFIPEKYTVDDIQGQHTTLKDVLLLLKTNKNIYPVALLQFIVGIAANLTVTSYYFLYIVKNVEVSGVMGMFGMLAMVTMIFYPMLLKKISTKQLIQYGLMISVAAAVLNLIAGANLVLLAIGGIILGVSSLPCSYMTNILAIDCADYNEWKGNARMEGTMCSVTGFANKLGAAFGTFLIGVLLTSSGFDGTLEVQPDSAIMMIRFCYAVVPVIFYVLGAFSLKFYKLDQMKAQISAEIEERRKKAAE